MFVLDTNTIIYFFKGVGQVATHIAQTKPDEIFVPSIVYYELSVGVAKSRAPLERKKQLDAFMAVVSLLPFSEKEAVIAADIRANLEIKGQIIGPYDILIAATALEQNATLVTHNTTEFSRVENLMLQDWF